MTMRTLWIATLLLTASLVGAQNSGSEAYLPAQAAADVLRDVANADGAFIASGQLKGGFDRENLASLMQFPDEEIVMVTLKGSEVLQALERSVSLYPQSNTSFLQLSGFEVTFDPNAMSGKRIKSVSAGGSRLEEGRDYRIAMPSSLGRGGFGYFKIWDRAKVSSTLSTTVEKALAGKKFSETRPRWIVQ
jgi:hypothetical protein